MPDTEVEEVEVEDRKPGNGEEPDQELPDEDEVEDYHHDTGWPPPEGAVVLGPGMWAMPMVATVEYDDETGLPKGAEETPEPDLVMGTFVPSEDDAPEVDEEGETVTTTDVPVVTDGPPVEGIAPLPDFSMMTVNEVKEWVDANPERSGDAYSSEMDGKRRSTLLDWLESYGSET